MATINNFSIDITRNGDTLDCVSGSFTRSGSENNIQWELKTIGPIADLNLDTDTFSMALSIEGKSWVRFADCKATNATKGTDSSTAEVGDTVSGTFSLIDSDLLGYSCPQTLCFCNAEWVTKTFGPTVVTNGVLRTKPSGGFKGGRCTHARLPGTEYEEGTFKVIPLSGASHHSIAKYLCNLIGINLVVTTEDIPLIDTYTVSSGTSWLDAIKANFTMWSPDIRIEAPAQGGQLTLYILDVINSAGGPTTTKPIVIDNAIISSHQHTRVPDSDSVHVIITGRAAPDTKFSEDPDFTPRKIPEISLSPNFERKFDMPVKEMLAYKEMGEYTGDFGTGDDRFSISQVQKAICTYKYYRYFDNGGGGEQYLILEEIHDTIDKTGALVSRIHTERKYGEGYKNVRTKETEYVRTNMPGSSQQSLKKMKIKHTLQMYVIKALNQAMTNEFVEQVVLVDKVKKATGQYMDDPNPMLGTKRIDRSRTAIDKQPQTSQATIEMTTHFKRTFISRTSDSVLEKRDLDFDVLSATARLASQVIQNPKPQDRTEKGNPFRREYYHGTPKTIGEYVCYKKSVSIKHDDICNDHIASAIAERIFYRYGADDVSMTVKTSAPVPIGVLPVKATVSPVEVETNADPGVVTDPEQVEFTPSTKSAASGADLFVYQVQEAFSTSRNINNKTLTFEQTFQLRSRL